MKYKFIKPIFTRKNYMHFDNDPGLSFAKKYIKDPQNISKHAFFPFILDEKKYIKFTKVKGKDNKTRPIMFSSHIDRYIYQWYNRKLNIIYNKYAEEKGIKKCSVAYRYNFRKNNIDIAKEVLCKISNMNKAYIIVGDFKSFFDKLNHIYLKNMLCKMMNVGRLPEDIYAVYKNITKFSYFDINYICQFLNINKSEFYRSKEVIDRNILKFNKQKNLKVNRKPYGIPQGSAISSVLSNIYMIDCDKLINNYVTSKSGIYRRYSDDFIIAIPDIESEELKEILQYINNVFKSNGNPEPENNKTKVFKYENRNLENVTSYYNSLASNTGKTIQYLGFNFDGKNIKICDRTKSKFIHKMGQKIKTIAICKGVTKKGNKISEKELRRLYSRDGKDKGKGNFITYSERCDKVFKNIDNYKSFTQNCEIILKRRISKIKKKYKNVNTLKYYIAIKKKKKLI